MTIDIEYEFYEQFFFGPGLEPYAVQEEAFKRIFAGESVLVTVPTGTGKTMMAKAAIFKALALGQTAIYTTPLRALTEEKYRELAADFGDARVGFATGDYRVNAEAPVQVVVAEILWNRIFASHDRAPAEVVILDEGHYFNDPERGYVWEQSVIGLDARAQLVILSATIGNPGELALWASRVRGVPMEVVESRERRVPLYHEFREATLVDTVRELFAKREYPAIIFVFGREMCFEKARLLKSCPRFTTDEERARIDEAARAVLLDRGLGPDLRPFLLHGIGIHHAGVLPRYKRLVEELALARLVKFIVSTETIAAGINLPAKRVVFPELKKVIKGEPRLLTSAEYHQMAGRAGRPQFDTEGIAIALAPEEVVSEIGRETRAAQKGRFSVDMDRIRRSAYARARADAQRNGAISWDPDAHRKIVDGKPAPLRSQTRVAADQILAIGLPDSATPSAALNIRDVIDSLFADERTKETARRQLAALIDNLRALGIIDEQGRQLTGEMVARLRGIDGPFVYYALMTQPPTYEALREMVELLVEHDVVHKILARKDNQKRREWVLARLRERRREEPHLTFEDVEAEYDREFPRVLSATEEVLQRFFTAVPHPEVHGGKTQKVIWTEMEAESASFLDFVEKHALAHEEGSLFSYLARVMKAARLLHEATGLEEFRDLGRRVRAQLAVIDERVVDELWNG